MADVWFVAGRAAWEELGVVAVWEAPCECVVGAAGESV